MVSSVGWLTSHSWMLASGAHKWEQEALFKCLTFTGWGNAAGTPSWNMKRGACQHEWFSNSHALGQLRRTKQRNGGWCALGGNDLFFSSLSGMGEGTVLSSSYSSQVGMPQLLCLPRLSHLRQQWRVYLLFQSCWSTKPVEGPDVAEAWGDEEVGEQNWSRSVLRATWTPHTQMEFPRGCWISVSWRIPGIF